MEIFQDLVDLFVGLFGETNQPTNKQITKKNKNPHNQGVCGFEFVYVIVR